MGNLRVAYSPTRCCTTGWATAATSRNSPANSASSTFLAMFSTYMRASRVKRASTDTCWSTSLSVSPTRTVKRRCPAARSSCCSAITRQCRRHPARPAIATREPGVHLDADTISWLGRPLEPLSSYPIDANDIRRWALTSYYPEPAPHDLTEIADATAGPWHESVALRDFDPFVWNQAFRPDIYPWMHGMGTEPGRRGLNGGQRVVVLRADTRVGDVITNNVMLIDAFEKEGRMGTMLFLVDESRWTNQRDELVRIGQRTSIYY